MATAYFFPIKCPMGAVAKISTNGLEYHVMGITPLGTDEKTGKPKSLALIKSLGDWTTKLNSDTRDEAKLRDMTFYIARVKPPNFTQGLFNWERVFILVTGVGIAPCIPYVTNDISWRRTNASWIGGRESFMHDRQFIGHTESQESIYHAVRASLEPKRIKYDFIVCSLR
eukprot:462588_1